MINFNSVENTVLLRAVLDGNEYAWDEFQNRFARVIYGVAITTFKRSQEDAQEDYQNVVLKLLANNCRSIRQYLSNPEKDFHSYLIAIIKNTIIDTLRKKGKEKISSEALGQQVRMSEESVPGVAEVVEKNEVIKDIAGKVVRQLNEEDKVVFQLYFFDDLPYKEIAEIINDLFGRTISVSSVGVKITRIREKLLKEAEKADFAG